MKTTKVPAALKKIKHYVAWVCHDCGIAHGNWYKNGEYVGPKGWEPTMHYDTCDLCGTHNVPCTEPRDYGHLRTENI